MIKKVFILAIIILNVQNLTFAATVCSGKNSKERCYIKNEPVQVRDLKNGYSQIKVNIGGQTYYSIDRSYDALWLQHLFNEGLKYSQEMAAEEKKKEKIIKANAQIITKRVTVTTKNGIKITLEEDKNKDDFLVVNNKRTKIAHDLVNSQPKINNNKSNFIQISDNSNPSVSVPSLSVTYTQELINSEKTGKKQKSYAEIVAENKDIDELVKLVYILRDKYGVSYTDAQKLMTFRNNSNFNAEDLLLPTEISKNNYESSFKQSESKFKNLAFPKI